MGCLHPPSRQAGEESLIVAPALADLDLQIQEEPPAGFSLQFLAGGRADVADHGSTAADHDSLLAFSLDADRRRDDCQVLLRVFLHGLDNNGRGERELLARALEELLADDFRD